jgi:hypothetical protein
MLCVPASGGTGHFLQQLIVSLTVHTPAISGRHLASDSGRVTGAQRGQLPRLPLWS